jgi:hypothetical protein
MQLAVLLLPLFLSAHPVPEWDAFEKKVRDQNLSKENAKAVFSRLYQDLKHHASQYPFSDDKQWVFPVLGYSIKDVGQGGYKPNSYYGSSPHKGYNFYDGNQHGGHPAYDIFIKDKDQDCRDDRTAQPVPLVAPVDLLILSQYDSWQQSSLLRGGNYIWALNPPTDKIFYFAHLDSIQVHNGDMCPAGTTLGTLGRSGKNAWPKRSPTHLHLMVLKVQGNDLVPVDYWKNLKNAKQP